MYVKSRSCQNQVNHRYRIKSNNYCVLYVYLNEGVSGAQHHAAAHCVVDIAIGAVRVIESVYVPVCELIRRGRLMI